MDALAYFLIWGALIFLMMRFGCGAHVAGHGHHASKDENDASAEGLRWIAPETDTDPVCGKTVRTQNAKPSVHDGSVYYFCSRDCREIFEAAPDQYLGESAIVTHQYAEPSHG
ncbi:MAG: YHS domain-containing protein [Hyphomicrobiaceae bacterium]